MAGPIVGVFVVDNSLPPTGAPLVPLVLAGLVAVAIGLTLHIPIRRRS